MQPYKSISRLNLNELLNRDGFPCRCGKHHVTGVREIVVCRGAMARVPELARKYGGTRVYVIADRNTFEAAGEAVCGYLKSDGVPYSCYVFPDDSPEPDEYSVGRAVMHFDAGCDYIIGIGSGVINDIGKILARLTGLPYMIVGTAPSMDGFASATSSVLRDGVKISLDSVCPSVIVADLDIVARAPQKLLQAGIGDMLAKFVSICEWRISHVVTGEYYCEEVASLVRSSLKKCLEAKKLPDRDPEAVRSVMEGLILSGMAMEFAGLSRPASGMEHYFSHLWDIRSLEFGTPATLHGIQCGVATLLSLRIYDFIRKSVPNREKALDYTRNFSLDDWNRFLAGFLGKSAGPVIAQEKREGKYSLESHRARLEAILNHWGEIVRIISEELPPYNEAEQVLRRLGAPLTPEQLGHSAEEVRNTFLTTKDVRNKYIGSRLLWDLGLLDEAARLLCE